METSPIYELLPAFKERNHVIFMLLGLLSVSQDWMRLLESEADNTRLHEVSLISPKRAVSAPEPSEPYTSGTRTPVMDTSTRGFLYFLLGTVSFTGHFTRTLDTAKISEHPSTPDELPDLTWGDLGEFLR